MEPRTYLTAAPRYTQVSGGASATCALTASGAIDCWGASPSSPPTAGTSFTAVSLGWTHGCALTAAGAIACWGDNRVGQTNAPAGMGYRQVSAGAFHTCAISDARTLACWGGDGQGEVSGAPTDPGYTQVSAGVAASCAVTASERLECWGEPSTVYGGPSGSTGYVQVSVGYAITCALTTARALVCWGPSSLDNTPPSGTGYREVAAGNDHACALTADGGIVCWGGNTFGQATPPAGTGYTQVTAGSSHSCALTATGTVTCWGANTHGHLTPPRPRVLPTAVFSAPATAVAGQPFTLTLANAQVPGYPQATQFTYAFDCGTGYQAATPAASASCPTTSAGPRTVQGRVVDQDGDTASYSAVVDVVWTPQAITFTSTAPSAAVVGGTYAVSATGGASGNPVVLSTLTPATCTLTGNTVRFAATGTCTIAADQAGSATHTAAPQRTQTMNVASALKPQAITFANRLQDEIGVLGLFTLVRATGGGSGQPVVLTSRTPATCTIGSPTPLGVTLRFLAVGPCTIAADQAGNTTHAPAPTVTQTMKVVYPFIGFLPPVNGGLAGSAVVNVVAAGKAIPLRFTLAADRGLGVLAGAPTSKAVACPARTREARVEETVAARASGLAYDARRLQYTYTWATDAAWAGTCRRFTLALTDGTTQSATFRFAK